MRFLLFAYHIYVYIFYSFTGAVLLWDLNNLESSPFLLKVDDWSSPPSHVVFNFPNQRKYISSHRTSIIR